MYQLRPVPVGLFLGFAFAFSSVNARAQNNQPVQIPTNDAAARAEAPKEPAIPTVPPNTPAAIFGGKHQLTIASDAGLSISNTTVNNGGGSTTNIQLQPAVDYFIIDNLSLGGFLLLNYTHAPSAHSTTFGIGPRIGYNIPLSPLLSIWPKLGFSFSSVTSSGRSDSNNLALNIFVPLMVHPAPHFFLGFGPALDVDLTGDTKSTTIAGRLTIGGWL